MLAGCGSDDGPKGPNRVSLAGAVTLDGSPLEGAQISFFNKDDTVGMITNAEGKYHIPIGAIPGEYKVTVSKIEGEAPAEGVAVDFAAPSSNPEQLPAHYSNRDQTQLKYTVPAEGTEAANFDLRSN